MAGSWQSAKLADAGIAEHLHYQVLFPGISCGWHAFSD